jgi:hypothetical protein
MPFWRTTAGMTAMHLACMKGHLELAQYLFGVGLDPSAADSKGRTPLHLATAGQHAATVLWLLGVGANHAAQDTEGKTAQSLANALATVSGVSKDLAVITTYLQNAASPPAAPTALRLLDAEEANIIAAVSKSSHVLPAPGCGVTHNTAYLRWDLPAPLLGGSPATEFGMQFTTKWAIGWTDCVLMVSRTTEEGNTAVEQQTTTTSCYACAGNLPSNTTLQFRVRARNANGWGAFVTSSKFDEITTLPPPPVVPETPTPAATPGAASTPSGSGGKDGGREGGGEGGEAKVPEAPKPVLTLDIIELATAGNVTKLIQLTSSEAEMLDIAVRGIAEDSGRTALHLASSNGHLELVLWLVERGTQLGTSTYIYITFYCSVIRSVMCRCP